MPLIPFDPEKHTPKDIGLGGESTEYLVTTETDDGEVIVIPSIWWTEDGEPVFFGDTESDTIDTEAIKLLAKEYENKTGNLFPRFGDMAEENYQKADEWAQKRSKAGGATFEALVIPTKSSLQPTIK